MGTSFLETAKGKPQRFDEFVGGSLESKLRGRAAGLGLVQLDSEHWNDLHLALDAAAAGRQAAVLRWIDVVEETFLKSWDSYEQSSVLESEVTRESVVGHLLFLEGVEGWLEALAQFRDSVHRPDRSAILSRAEQGQRLLIAVQELSREEDVTTRFLAAWSN